MTQQVVAMCIQQYAAVTATRMADVAKHGRYPT